MLRYSNTLIVNTFIKRLVSVLPSTGATMESLPTPVLVAFGIPTTDFSFLVSDKSIIEKYELNIDSQREMTNDLLELIKLEFHGRQYKFKKLAGGNCQVSLMVFQSLLQDRCQTVMCGAIGDDEDGLFVHEYLTNKSVRTNFDVIENTKTAKCVIAVHKDLRTIAVMNGVGSEYSLQQCDNFKQKLNLAISSTIVLFEGFFVGFSYDIALPIMQKCKRNGNIIALNISAVYIIDHFSNQFLQCWKKCDILIGNQTEFDALCRALRLSSKSPIERAKIVQNMMLLEKSSGRSKLPGKEEWKKILIVTNNKEPVHCVYGDNILIEFDVPRVLETDIVDTSGAGDSFLGGFLYSLVNENPIERCLEIGCLVSSKVIQQHGYEI